MKTILKQLSYFITCKLFCTSTLAGICLIFAFLYLTRTNHPTPCYFDLEDDLPLLDDKELLWRPIFFIHTSCEGQLNQKAACHIESAARMNPNSHIYVLFTGPLKGKNYIGIHTIEEIYLNIHFRRIHLLEYIKGTPVENFFSKDIFVNAYDPQAYTLTVLKLLTLYKYGGMYFDQDVMAVRTFANLAKNFVGRVSETYMSDSIIAATKDGIGKNFTTEALNEITRQYSESEINMARNQNGAYIVTNVMRKLCNSSDEALLRTFQSCQDFQIYKSSMFRSIYYDTPSKYFKIRNEEPVVSQEFAHQIKVSYRKKKKTPENCDYKKLALTYCPYVAGAKKALFMYLNDQEEFHGRVTEPIELF